MVLKVTDGQWKDQKTNEWKGPAVGEAIDGIIGDTTVDRTPLTGEAKKEGDGADFDVIVGGVSDEMLTDGSHFVSVDYYQSGPHYYYGPDDPIDHITVFKIDIPDGSP